MIRACNKCGDLYDVGGAEDALRWLSDRGFITRSDYRNTENVVIAAIDAHVAARVADVVAEWAEHGECSARISDLESRLAAAHQRIRWLEDVSRSRGAEAKALRDALSTPDDLAAAVAAEREAIADKLQADWQRAYECPSEGVNANVIAPGVVFALARIRARGPSGAPKG